MTGLSDRDCEIITECLTLCASAARQDFHRSKLNDEDTAVLRAHAEQIESTLWRFEIETMKEETE